jgi:hypothetical protein
VLLPSKIKAPAIIRLSRTPLGFSLFKILAHIVRRKQRLDAPN